MSHEELKFGKLVSTVTTVSASLPPVHAVRHTQRSGARGGYMLTAVQT